MNRIHAFALLFFLTASALIGQGTLYYTINLGTFVDASRDDFRPLQSVGFIYSYKLENNFSQVYLGGYDTKQAASAALTKIQSAGYSAAYIQERFLKDGQTVTVIQVGAVDIRQPVNWEKYGAIPELWGVTSGDQLKLVAGPYNNLEEARQSLPGIQKQGFRDAFIRNINSIFLIKIGSFETGNQIKQPLIQFKWNGERETAPTQKTPPATEPPASYEYAEGRKSPSAVPSTVQAKTPSPNVREYEALIEPAPSASNIRSNVKRRAAIELQKLLKAENFYKGSLDGYYGAGTATAYQTALQNNRELFKYRLLIQNTSAPGNAGSGDPLQNAINRLPEDSRAPLVLESYNHPVAKVYQAYQIFMAYGPGADVNNLMNAAIRQAYLNKPLKAIPPFDYRASYAYNDLDQLVQHIYYIHAAPDISYSLPCWLSSTHPLEAARAQASLGGYGNAGLKVQSCDPFSKWEEVLLLEALAADLGASAPNPAQTAEAASARAALFLANRPMSAAAEREIESWYAALMANLSNWANRDPLHQKMTAAYKIAFFQACIRMEDFYMDKGFGSEEAKSLALATARAIVGPSLARFE
ncbi:MAG: hypothetical protein IPH16_15435 [Haliscomenobacter sp.]|nr:hypothetical protein [Haliscomenobacter sp.]